MKLLKITLAALSILLLTLGMIVAPLQTLAPSAVSQPMPMSIPLVQDTLQVLQIQAARSIELAQPHLSLVRKKLIMEQIAIIASRGSNIEHAKQWIALIGAESGYDGRARSNKGAVGLGQLIPRYRDDFGASCGLKGVAPEDLADDYTNLTLSHCYFLQLINANGGDSYLAQIAYLAGQYSKDLADAKAGKKPSQTAKDYTKSIKAKKEAASDD